MIHVDVRKEYRYSKGAKKFKVSDNIKGARKFTSQGIQSRRPKEQKECGGTKNQI